MSNNVKADNVTGGIIGGRDASGVAGQGAAGRDISGTVSVAINQLPDAPEPGQPGVKELLIRLQQAISAESNLEEDDKQEAQEQLKNLAEAAQNPQDEGMKKIAKRAIQMLKGIFVGLPAVAKLAETAGEILPSLVGLFGLE